MRLVIAAAALSAATPAAQAQQGFFNLRAAEDGAYVFAFGGGAFTTDQSFTGVAAPEAGVPGPAAGADLAVDIEGGASIYFGGGLGYQLPFTYLRYFHPRIEVEASRFSTDVDGGAFNGGDQTFRGEQSATLIFLNNYSDIVWSENQRVTPYVGGGLGVAITEYDVLYAPTGDSNPAFGLFGNQTAFAGTVAAGATVNLGGQVELYSEGRYFRAYGVETQRRFVGSGDDALSGVLDGDLEGFNVIAGLRYRYLDRADCLNGA